MDVAAVVEEVVDVAVVGQGFQSMQHADLGDLEPNARGRARKPPSTTSGQLEIPKPPVIVVLDIAQSFKGHAWVTQPGALRRLVMNLVGNVS